MQYLLSSEESRVATLIRSKIARNSGDLAPIHLLSSIRFLLPPAVGLARLCLGNVSQLDAA